MQTDKRPQFGLNEIAVPACAIILWHTTIYLLGLPDTMPPGIKAKIGSFIVLIGCFVIARPVVSMTAQLFRPKPASPVASRTESSPATEASAIRPRSALFRRSASRSNLER